MVPEPASGWPYSQLLEILARTRSAGLPPRPVQAYAASVDTTDWCLVALKLQIGGRMAPSRRR